IGMGAKETMIVAPAIVALWDRIFLKDGAVRWRLYVALTATIAIALLPMLAETQGRAAIRVLFSKVPGGWTPWYYLWTQAGVIAHYLVLAFKPSPLVFDYYDWPHASSPLDVLPQALLVTGLFALTVWGVVRRSPAAFAGAVFFLVLAPTSSLLPIPTEIAA